MEGEHPVPQPDGGLEPPDRHPPTAVAAATPPRPPYREEESLPDRPRWLRVLSRATHHVLDALDWAGDGVATLVG
ncbi:MAG TPA: hypothetical protein VGD77_08355, partial [Gemmatimonadaceae bacterium]